MEISSSTRQFIIEDLIEIGSVEGQMEVSEFVRRVFPKVNDMKSTDHRFVTAIEDIWQHMDNNPGDWTYQYLFFHRLKLLEVDDTNFIYFLEQYVHPTIRRFKWEEGQQSKSLSRMSCV